ncbi:uncharacterized protein [Venturia canescens]|uniref:uncharacterized protein n=1 Tax=Venturia canescens TaxID=32260 RepID=UPI001C9CC34B|nr:uncharacterized protein LOC122411619 [Venturia canescens]
MELALLMLGLLLFVNGYRGESDTEDYTDVSVTAATLQIDMSEDFDQWEINEYEDPVTKTYHCSAQSQKKNDTLQPNLETIKFLDDNGLGTVRPQKHYYQVHHIRQRMCQFGFDPSHVDIRSGSIHKRFKNTLRLMVYNTPGMFPSLKIIRNDLDRKRRREPQIWFRFETSNGPLISEFDFDNYFITVSGDFSRIQAYSKMLVALKMHKRLNNFNDSVSYKVNLDLGIIEVIMSSFGIALMRDKSMTNIMVKALNGVRTEIKGEEDVQLEFEESLKDAADQVDPLMYSSIWLLSMAEKYEVVRIRDRARNIQVRSLNKKEKTLV